MASVLRTPEARIAALPGGTAMAVPVMTAEFKVNCVRPGTGQRLA